MYNLQNPGSLGNALQRLLCEGKAATKDHDYAQQTSRIFPTSVVLQAIG